MISQLLNEYGQDISMLASDGSVIRAAKGFVQPVNYADVEELWNMTPGGGVRREKYLLIADAEAFGGEGAERSVLFDGNVYTVLRADKYDALAGAAHWEAILCPEGRRLV